MHLGNDRTWNFLPNLNRTEPLIFFAEPNFCAYDLRSYQLKLIKMRAELANLNHCEVLFLSRAAINLSLYNSSPVMKWTEFLEISYEFAKKIIQGGPKKIVPTNIFAHFGYSV